MTDPDLKKLSLNLRTAWSESKDKKRDVETVSIYIYISQSKCVITKRIILRASLSQPSKFEKSFV